MRYQKAFPGDALFVVRAQAQVAAGADRQRTGWRYSTGASSRYGRRNLVKGYYDLLESGHLTLKTRDELRANCCPRIQTAEPMHLNDAAKLFYIDQQQGQLEAAKAVLADYRTRKDGARRSVECGRIVHPRTPAGNRCRIFLKLRATTMRWQQTKRLPMPRSERAGGSGAPAAHCAGAAVAGWRGQFALYKSIATMDRGPGYLNGILSLFLNSQDAGGRVFH